MGVVGVVVVVVVVVVVALVVLVGSEEEVGEDDMGGKEVRVEYAPFNPLMDMLAGDEDDDEEEGEGEGEGEGDPPRRYENWFHSLIDMGIS